MSYSPPDRTNCDKELLHLIGAVQSFGCIIAVGISSRKITHVTQNVTDALGWSVDALLGQPISTLVEKQLVEKAFADAPLRPGEVLASPISLVVKRSKGGTSRLVTQIYRDSEHYFLELFLHDLEAHSSSMEARRDVISQLRALESVEGFVASAARLVRSQTGYDRVMCYRFHQDGHGEVIAEETDLQESYLGLHYPASDIPEPARRQFLLNRVRIIEDIDAPIRQIIGSETLDLSFSKLRAVSPIHLTYLRNMGVTATLVLPLVVAGKLWGLMVCHHSTPKLLSAMELHSAELVSQIFELLLENILRTERDRQIIRTQEIAYSFAHTDTAKFELKDVAEKLADHFAADFVAGFIDGVWHPLYNWPTGEIDFSSLHSKTHEDVFVTDDISTALPQDVGGDLAGCAFLSIDEQRNDYIVLGRKRFENIVSWAGAPKKAVGFDEDGLPILKPRASFGRWKETVADKSEPFTDTDQLALAVVLPSVRALLSSKKAQRLADSASLMEHAQTELRNQLLNTARSASLGELAAAIAHELNQPLTSISNYVSASRLLLKNATKGQEDDVVELLESAVTEAQRAGQIVHHLRNLMKPGFERKLEFDANDMLKQAVTLALTSSKQGGVHLDLNISPDPILLYADKVQIEQVVFNLVRNAVEAMDGMETRLLTVSSLITDGGQFEVSIKDTGAGIDEKIRPYLFEPFQTSKADGMGIGLSLCRSTIEDHQGRIWATETDEGAHFKFAIPLGQSEVRHES